MIKSLTIAEHLSSRAASQPNKVAVICPDGAITYGELEERSSRCGAGMREIGIGPGTRTVLMVTPGLEFMILTFGLLKAGAVLVAVDPGIGWKNLGQCLREAAPEAFVGISKAHAARVFFGWGKPTVRIKVTVGRRWFWGGETVRTLEQKGLQKPDWVQETSVSEKALDQTAAVVFTSGSTGVPKGVVYTHRMFSSGASLLQENFSIQPGEVDLATFPLFALFDPAWGATTIFPDMDFTRPAQVDPEEIIRRIQAHQVTHMFGSPALLNRVGRYCVDRDVSFPSLKRVLSAGAPVAPEILQRFSKLLPEGGIIFTPYGATEALPVCSIGHPERLEEEKGAEGAGVCIGRPLAGLDLSIIKVTDEALEQWSDDLLVSQGEVGELVVRGQNVSQQYDSRPEANRLAKIRDQDGTVRHRMGDLGYLDERGRVWFCGRKSHRVVTSEGDLYTVPCEGIFNQHPEVFRTALVGMGGRPNQKPVICVELEDKKRWRGSSELRQQLLSLGRRHPMTASIETILFHKGFPVDVRHNSKIYREQLTVWAAGQVGLKMV